MRTPPPSKYPSTENRARLGRILLRMTTVSWFVPTNRRLLSRFDPLKLDRHSLLPQVVILSASGVLSGARMGESSSVLLLRHSFVVVQAALTLMCCDLTHEPPLLPLNKLILDHARRSILALCASNRNADHCYSGALRALRNPPASKGWIEAPTRHTFSCIN